MIHIRYADINDAELLGAIHSASWKRAYKGILSDEVLDDITAERRASYFRKALSEGWEEDAILFHPDQAIGMICIGKSRDPDLNENWGEIRGIYLLPEYWKKGFGSMLISWGIRELEQRGFTHVSLWVLEENFSARDFYVKTGFIHDGAVKEVHIGKTVTEMRYTLKIS